MSWDADLIDVRPEEVRVDVDGDPYRPVLRFWNYTHNTNPMINAALDATGFLRPVAVGPYDFDQAGSLVIAQEPRVLPWWSALDGLPGPEGAALLHRIIRELEADPIRFEALNPPNGWGDYDSLLGALREMRASVPEWPTTWKVYG